MTTDNNSNLKYSLTTQSLIKLFCVTLVSVLFLGLVTLLTNPALAGTFFPPSYADTMLESDQVNVWFGVSVAGTGDVNGDGYDDVMVGRQRADAESDRPVVVYYGGRHGVTRTTAITLTCNDGDAAFGSDMASIGDVNGDGYGDIVVGAPWYAEGAMGSGAAFLYYGSATGLTHTAAVTLENNRVGGEFAKSVSGAGDVNGDGYDDLVVGISENSCCSPNGEDAFVYYGGPNGISDTVVTAIMTYTVHFWHEYIDVAGGGDINGDGYDDVIVGATRSPFNSYDKTAILMVYYGTDSGLNYTQTITFEGALSTLRPYVAGAGDVNADGYGDVIVGMPDYSNGESGEGIFLVYHGSVNGLTSTPVITRESNQTLAWMGYVVASAGDMNNDGYDDIIIGAEGYDNGEEDEGAAFLHYGSASGITHIPAITYESNQVRGVLGGSVAGAGDVNADGVSDVIIGAPGYSNGQLNEGAAFVYHGKDPLSRIFLPLVLRETP